MAMWRRTEASKDLHASKLTEYIWGQAFCSHGRGGTQSVKKSRKCRRFFFFFETPWCTKNDVQCQFHSQIYLRCIIFIFVFFSFITYLFLGLAWISLLDFLFFCKHRSRKSHVAPVVQIQVDGMIKVDQSGIPFWLLTHVFFCRPVVSRIVMATGHGSKSSQKKSFKRGSPKISLCRSIFFQTMVNITW